MTELLTKICDDLKLLGFDGVLISRNDSFLGEYNPCESDRLFKVTGFTGSAGVCFVSATQKVLFVDSRYTEQAKEQSDFDVYEVPRETKLSTWLKENAQNKKIAFNAWTHSVLFVEQMRKILQKEAVVLEELPDSVIQNWFGVSGVENKEVFDYELKYTGQGTAEKLKRLQSYILEHNLDGYIITEPENVSWLLNKRSRLVGEYPVIFERGYVDKEGRYQTLSIQNDFLKGKRIGIELASTPYALLKELSQKAKLVDLPDAVSLMKAVKNPVEIHNIKEACLSESKTICRFLAWIEKEKETISELDCTQKLQDLRQEDPLYFADSFDTIAAAGNHAALAHYMATPNTSYKIKDYPMLMVDTGGHYLNGTTDMTRTICISAPTPVMKKRYTQVLKGHIALASTHLTDTSTTALLDKRAHQYLRADGVDYLHATSHGIGMMLAVHEMPPIVHERDTQGMKAGMVFSNEPAYYDAQAGYGIRLENMLLSVADEKGGLIFENLLFAPFDYRLIDFDLLSIEEKRWLKEYHQIIKDKIFILLNQEEQHILEPLINAFLKDK